jgi:hypothetical protein
VGVDLPLETRMFKLRRAASATLVATAIMASAGMPASAQTTSAASTAALQYLGRQQSQDGSLPGFSPATETENYIWGAAAAGFDPNTLKAKGSCTSVFDYLGANLAAETKTAGATAQLVLAVLAGGRNPRAFPDTSSDLLAKLDSFYDSSTGDYGDPAKPDPSGHALAVLAILAAADSSHPLGAKAEAYLVGLQAADGGWGYGGTSDSNTTSVALMALATFTDSGANTSRSNGLAYLKTQQNANGGFTLSSGYDPAKTPDPDSDALVIQAVLASGQDPTGAGWTTAGNNAMTDLLTFQQTNTSDAAYGGFSSTKPVSSNPPDAYTTSQVPAALNRRPLPPSRNYAPGAAVPGQACVAGASVAASPRPAPTPSAAALAPTGTGAEPHGSQGPWFLLAALPLALGAASLRGSRRRG